ncbi:penicillin-binding protein [Virgibacillus indicus]|uniref:Penicillin-binding protein n=1 Tax=Virgibacillus indicus TaxID=2024554 RepID=A0A265NEC6_9BACI|nr:serine hydrolase [Virgibacillus indicus]OZU89646.1 penicillin-binding protein [Virgibacillus indicus]
MNEENKLNYLGEKQEELRFSGTFYAAKGNEILEGSSGFANRSEKIDNQLNTRFAIASGCKIFTSVAICILVEAGKISFKSRLKDCLDIDFPYFDKNITIHHLLTHTSGVHDYFNEEIMDDFELLWKSRPVYQIRSPKDFLPMFQYERMQAPISSSFQYNNTGYILLGLIVEQVAKCSFSEFVEEQIFHKAGMRNSGYFEIDRLPEMTALGYIDDSEGNWKTNIYSLPAKGGPDGGAYVTAEDMFRFWEALTNHQLLSKEMTQTLLKPREAVAAEDDIYYGYCGYMELDDDERVVKFIQMGYDPGVNFRAVYYPDTKTTIVVCSNESEGAYELLKEIENII